MQTPIIPSTLPHHGLLTLWTSNIILWSAWGAFRITRLTACPQLVFLPLKWHSVLLILSSWSLMVRPHHLSLATYQSDLPKSSASIFQFWSLPPHSLVDLYSRDTCILRAQPGVLSKDSLALETKVQFSLPASSLSMNQNPWTQCLPLAFRILPVASMVVCL